MIVMEVQNLGKRWERENRIIQSIMSQILFALDGLRSTGIVHRNIKLQNIIFSEGKSFESEQIDVYKDTTSVLILYTSFSCAKNDSVQCTKSWEVLRGDHIGNSPFVFKLREAEMCAVLCQIKLDAETVCSLRRILMMKSSQYVCYLFLEILNLSFPVEVRSGVSNVDQLGYHIGLEGQYSGSKEEKFFIHNHLAFTVKNHWELQTDCQNCGI
ncbi:hypothetical protein COLO4_17600 [Corchorus olitorius]|uniref:Uncharacterized protein n=1 Tax=Corchorus olitorius TaxID=93759 RepID=A0A1R3JC52_9ROSI|nr:hypothetical protein COLO4_17600 [Corchorus olitorius]